MPTKSFGGIALIENQPRSATVIAQVPTVLLVVKRDDYVGLLQGQEEFRLRKRVLFLREVPFLARFPQRFHVDLQHRFEKTHFNRGDVILRQGDVADRVYFVYVWKSKA